MKNEAVNKVFEYIDAMAANLGVASEHVYTILVRQQIVGGIIGLIVAVLIIFGGYFIVRKYTDVTQDKVEKIEGKRWYSRSDGEDVLLFSRKAIWVVYWIAVLISIFTIPYDITRLVNPEFYAIKEILNVFGK